MQRAAVWGWRPMGGCGGMGIVLASIRQSFSNPLLSLFLRLTIVWRMEEANRPVP
jgi:hypothetical protein